ncbi:hypothetical protein BX600DRAFT_170065 [Xylariales sp. PMI_506]|nr:hypothetical protein BX600DRAFT_170065 [Xylariales sp. PMI_506]
MKMASPAQKAVGYIKDTWRRVVKTKRGRITNRFSTFSSPPQRRNEPCVDRTQLDDVVDDEDDDELTVVASNDSYIAPSSVASGSSPQILDSQWRYFAETGLTSSPSTFLGHRSGSPETLVRDDMSSEFASVLTTPISITGSDGIVGNTSELEVNPNFYADNTYTMQQQQQQQHRGCSWVFANPKAAASCDSIQSSESNRTIATPTPGPHHGFRRSSSDTFGIEGRHNAGSDSPESIDAGAPLLSDTTSRSSVASSIHNNNVDDNDDDNNNGEETWSFVSVCGASTKDDLSEYVAADLPGSKHRKVTVIGLPRRDRVAPTTAADANLLPLLQSSSPRDHPRYSASYTPDPHKRTVQFSHWPAVFMTPPANQDEED